MVVQNSKGSQSVGRKEIYTTSLTLSLEESGDGDYNSSPRVGLKPAHVISPHPKIKCSPNQDKEEVAMDVYERPGNILEWESLQLENINIINRVVTQLELPVFEVNSISLHQVIFSPNTRKLQISKLKVKVKRVTKEENVALDPKEMGADREFKVHMAMANMLRH